jgi:hypothetical protein
MEPEQQKLDRWLDQALSDYGHADAHPGLESRILANLAEEKTKASRRTMWPWTFVSAVTALIVFTVIWIRISTQKVQTPSANIANHATVQQKQSMVAVQAAVQVPKAKNNQQTLRPQVKAPTLAKSPRLVQFPAVRELNTQEQLLVRYAREFPKQALEISQAQAVAEQERISGELAVE